jgi:hypothetical protein
MAAGAQNSVDAAGIVIKEGATKATWKLVAAQLGLNGAILPYILAVGAVVAIVAMVVN